MKKHLVWSVIAAIIAWQGANAQTSQATLNTAVATQLPSGQQLTALQIRSFLIGSLIPSIFQSQGASGFMLTGAPALNYVMVGTGAGAASWQTTVPSVGGVTFSGTPAAGYVPVATGPTAASWTAGIADKSTVIASFAKFWNPSVNGNAATGNIWYFNRVLVGTAALSSGDLVQGATDVPSTPIWLDTLFGNGIVGNSQFASVAALGTLAITGASRSSDYRTFAGAASQGSQGLTGIGVNDDTTGAPIAVGVTGIGVRATGVGGSTLGSQNDVNNGGATCSLSPFGVVGGCGLTAAGSFTAGAYASLAINNASAAWYVGPGVNKFEKGGVWLDGALNTAIGAGGNGVAEEFSRNQSLRWLNSGLTTDAEIWGNATGLHGTQQIIPISNGAQAQAQNTTAFQITLGAATEANVQALCPLGGAFRNLYLAVNPAPASGQTVTATWRVNGGDSTITCQATNGTPSCNDTTHTAVCTAGQSYSLKTVTSATSGSIAGIQAGIVFAP